MIGRSRVQPAMPPHLQLADLHARQQKALQAVHNALTTPTPFPEPPR